jgi:hypothetical protein
LGLLVERMPPTAVIVGVEASQFLSLEEPLQSLAGPDWPSETYPGDVHAYFRP